MSKRIQLPFDAEIARAIQKGDDGLAYECSIDQRFYMEQYSTSIEELNEWRRRKDAGE